MVLPQIAMKTEVPGPESQRLKADFAEMGGSGGAVSFFIDYANSDGCHIVDADGNRLLDVFQQVASLPLGYNHPALKATLSDSMLKDMMVTRPALGLFPPKEYPQLLRDTFLSIAPKGLKNVQTMLCGSTANENLYKAAFMAFRAAERAKKGLAPNAFTDEEMTTSLINQAPGCPNQLGIMSFQGGFHGRTFGCLSTTHTQHVHKLDVPAFDWPVAPFPQLLYPLEKHKEENIAEEKRCLEEVRRLFTERQNSNRDVAGVIVEPVLSEGGDFHASADFFKGLQKACKDFGAAFIVDEVQTGIGASGHMWAHEAWGLDEPPDFVSFSKKALIGGYYYKDSMQPAGGYRVFNTWMGDATKVIMFRAVLETIQKEGLLEKVRATGPLIKDLLQRASEKAPEYVSNIRGVGTLCAFDSATPAHRDKLHAHMRTTASRLSE